jgi:hypothetical protein
VMIVVGITASALNWMAKAPGARATLATAG